MSGCACLDMECDGFDDVIYRSQWVTMLSPYVCDECGERMPSYTKARVHFLVDSAIFSEMDINDREPPDGTPISVAIVCPVCEELVAHFVCGSRALGGLYEALHDFFFYDVDPCCLDGLSPEAVAKIEHYFE